MPLDEEYANANCVCVGLITVSLIHCFVVSVLSRSSLHSPPFVNRWSRSSDTKAIADVPAATIQQAEAKRATLVTCVTVFFSRTLPYLNAA